MVTSKHIPFGIRYGQIITIDEIKSTERGNRCDCTCPNCELPLIAIIDSLEIRPHFRHEKGHDHCHFEYDEIMLELILELIGELDDTLVINLITDGIKHFYVKRKNKHDMNTLKYPGRISKPQFLRNSKKEILFKVVVEGEDFQIRITTNKVSKLSLGQKELHISISDLISSKDSVTRVRIQSIVDEITKRIANNLADHIDVLLAESLKNKLNNHESVEQEGADSTHIDYSDELTDKEEVHIDNSKNFAFRDDKIRNASCPKCREGKLVVNTDKQGKKYFGCSKYPKCNHRQPW